MPWQMSQAPGESAMFAVLRLNSFDPDKLAASGERLEEFDKVHAAQPGHIGSVVVDVGKGRRFVLNLWESKEHSAAALSVLWESKEHSAAAFSVLGPEVGRLLSPLMSSPSEFVGVGNVISSDLVPSGG
jgi:hypothetical protein